MKRAAKLKIDTQLADLKGPTNVVVDSKGLKVLGEGEWKVRQHGVGKRRNWRKVHFAVDPDSHAILAELMTGSRTHDATAARPPLERVDQEVEAFYGDGAYDTWAVREHLQGESIHQIIPPQENAVIAQHGNSSNDPLERDKRVRQIRRDGKQAWKESIGYHRRSLAETAVSRLKIAFGDRLKNREPPSQASELALRCKLLNAFVALGMLLSI